MEKLLRNDCRTEKQFDSELYWRSETKEQAPMNKLKACISMNGGHNGNEVSNNDRVWWLMSDDES